MRFLLLLLGVLVACSSKSPPVKLDCNAMLSPEIRAKYFSAYEVHDSPATATHNRECEIRAKGVVMGVIDAACIGDIGDNVELVKSKFPDAKDLPGVGRAAVVIHDANETIVEAWDDDSPCFAVVDLSNKIDVAAFAKDLMAYLPPK